MIFQKGTLTGGIRRYLLGVSRNWCNLKPLEEKISRKCVNIKEKKEQKKRYGMRKHKELNERAWVEITQETGGNPDNSASPDTKRAERSVRNWPHPWYQMLWRDQVREEKNVHCFHLHSNFKNFFHYTCQYGYHQYFIWAALMELREKNTD